MAEQLRPVKPPIERVLRRCTEDDDGCWIFSGNKVTGYAMVSAGRRGDGMLLGHRVTYAYFIADVPEGLDLDHLCRKRECCNPWHLDPVTRAVNVSRGSRRHGYRDPRCPNGHEYTPENTRMLADGQRRCLTCLRARGRAAL